MMEWLFAIAVVAIFVTTLLWHTRESLSQKYPRRFQLFQLFTEFATASHNQQIQTVHAEQFWRETGDTWENILSMDIHHLRQSLHANALILTKASEELSRTASCDPRYAHCDSVRRELINWFGQIIDLMPDMFAPELQKQPGMRVVGYTCLLQSVRLLRV